MKMEDEERLKLEMLDECIRLAEGRFEQVTSREGSTHHVGNSEISSGCLYHRVTVRPEMLHANHIDASPNIPRGDIRFFHDPPKGSFEGNVYGGAGPGPSMLPGPCAFMIEAMKISGITTALSPGIFEFILGNKSFHEFPVWRLAAREKDFRMTPLIIAPHTMFFGRIRYEGNVFIEKPVRIELLLRGRIARPLQ